MNIKNIAIFSLVIALAGCSSSSDSETITLDESNPVSSSTNPSLADGVVVEGTIGMGTASVDSGANGLGEDSSNENSPNPVGDPVAMPVSESALAFSAISGLSLIHI